MKVNLSTLHLHNIRSTNAHLHQATELACIVIRTNCFDGWTQELDIAEIVSECHTVISAYYLIIW